MPTIPPVGSSNPGAPAPGTILLEAANRNAGKTALGQQDFLKLLGAQMTAQNPLEPMKDTEGEASVQMKVTMKVMMTWR